MHRHLVCFTKLVNVHVQCTSIQLLLNTLCPNSPILPLAKWVNLLLVNACCQNELCSLSHQSSNASGMATSAPGSYPQTWCSEGYKSFFMHFKTHRFPPLMIISKKIYTLTHCQRPPPAQIGFHASVLFRHMQ